MKYQVEAFSWGSDLVAPDVQRERLNNLEDARAVMNRYWEDAKCFHVRVLSSVDRNRTLNCNFHCMKSRPTTDRQAHLFFDKIKKPMKDETIISQDDLRVLRVSDFPFEVPASRLQIPAHQFYYDVQDSGLEPIVPGRFPLENDELDLQTFETSLAIAAKVPHCMDALMAQDENWWYFLSNVDILNGKATFSFDLMEAGVDFVH